MNQEKIGKFIASCRKDINMTQKDLAERLGVTDKTVSRWENGHYLPDVSLFQDLCLILNIQITELLNGEKTERNYEKEEIDNTMKNLVDLSTKEIKGKRRKFIITSSLIITVIVITTFTYLYLNHFTNKVNAITMDYKGIANKYFEYQLEDQGLKCKVDGNVINPVNRDQLIIKCSDPYLSFLKKDKKVNIKGLLENRISNKRTIYYDEIETHYIHETSEGLDLSVIYPTDESETKFNKLEFTQLYVNEDDEYVQAYFENGKFKVVEYVVPSVSYFDESFSKEIIVNRLTEQGFKLLEN